MELDMTKGSPTKLIARFIIPIIIGNLFQQLYSMADTIIVGHFVGVDAFSFVEQLADLTIDDCMEALDILFDTDNVSISIVDNNAD